MLNDKYVSKKISEDVECVLSQYTFNQMYKYNLEEYTSILDKLMLLAENKSVNESFVWVCKLCPEYVVEIWLKHFEKIDLTAVNSIKYNGLLYLVRNMFYSSAEKILNLDANVNQKSIYGEYPIILAVRNNDIEMIKLLLSFNADATVRDATNRSLYKLACELGSFKIKKLLTPTENSTDDASDNSYECPICWGSNDNRIHIIPCGHGPICPSCVIKMSKCPICKLHIQNTLRIYPVV